MPTRSTIPLQFTRRAFRTSEAIAEGLTAGALRGSRFLSLHHGVHAHKASRSQDELFLNECVASLAQDYSPLLRATEAFSHTTALLLYGAPLRTHDDIHVTAIYPTAQARGKGIRGHRVRSTFNAQHPATGCPCVPPELALAQCGSLLPFRELVVAADHLLKEARADNAPDAILDHSSLREYLGESTAPGIGRVRAACEVARVGAESRFETLLRFELARMGLDQLELQVDLFTQGGAWIGRFDMVDREKRRIVEYDGEQHRTDRHQYLKDLRRMELVRREG